MKTFITITAATLLSVTGVTFTAAAHEEDEEAQARLEQQRAQRTIYDSRGEPAEYNRVYEERGSRGGDDRRVFEFRRGGQGELRREVDHLNRMMNHVRGEIRAYGAGRRIRGQYEHLRAEGYQLNRQFERGEQYYDRRRVRAQIEHMHNELHEIEQNLHVRANDIYQWR